jgi:hypothetical protein
VNGDGSLALVGPDEWSPPERLKRVADERHAILTNEAAKFCLRHPGELHTVAEWDALFEGFLRLARPDPAWRAPDGGATQAQLEEPELEVLPDEPFDPAEHFDPKSEADTLLQQALQHGNDGFVPDDFELERQRRRANELLSVRSDLTYWLEEIRETARLRAGQTFTVFDLPTPGAEATRTRGTAMSPS